MITNTNSKKPEHRLVLILKSSYGLKSYKLWRVFWTFDGAVLKYIRLKIANESASLAEISISYLSKLESGHKPVSPEMRVRIMKALGYSTNSFKNLSADQIQARDSSQEDT